MIKNNVKIFIVILDLSTLQIFEYHYYRIELFLDIFALSEKPAIIYMLFLILDLWLKGLVNSLITHLNNIFFSFVHIKLIPGKYYINCTDVLTCVH